MKKQILKKTFALIISIVLIFSIIPLGVFTVSAEQDGDYTYTVNNAEATITEYIGNSGDITIPSTLGGYPVTSIGYRSFASKSIISVTIPDSVTLIGREAFRWCGNLTRINIGNNVTIINDYAFGGCGSLQNITIPNSVTNIGNFSFEFCNSFTSITIPNNVNFMGYKAFYHCSNLTNVSIGNGVTSIDGYAFAYCRNLICITIGNSVTSIGNNVFDANNKFTSINIPSSIIKIGDDSFSGCSGLTDVYYSGTEEEWNVLKSHIGSNNFWLLNANIHYNYVYNQSETESYSELLGDAWRNAGMEIFNEYLLTCPSISKAVIDSYSSNKKFLDNVSAWKTINMIFEPANLVDDALSMKDYYNAIILAIMDSEICDENYIKNIQDNGAYQFAKLKSSFEKIVSSCKEIDHEKLLNEGTCSIEDITKLNNQIETMAKYSEDIKNVSNFLSLGKTLNESINTAINYSNLCKTSQYVVNTLKEMRKNTSDMFLQKSIDEIVFATQDKFNSIGKGILKGSINVAKDIGVDKINEAWQNVMKTVPVFEGALLGYKLGKPLTNTLFKTDSIISNFFEFTALYEVEKTLRPTIKAFENDFYSKSDATASLNYINAISLFYKTYYLSCDYASQLAKYRYNCPFGYVFYNGKKNLDEFKKEFDGVRSSIRKSESELFRLWAYSLKEKYPEIFNEISDKFPNVYSTDLSNALVRLEYVSTEYDGVAKTPSVTVIMGTSTLSPGEYSVNYYNNIEPGVATVEIIANPQSIYSNSSTAKFVIKEPPFVKRLSVRTTKYQSPFKLLKTTTPNEKTEDMKIPDVYIYDGNKLVAAVENGVITCDDLPIFLSDDGVDALMQEKDYTVKFSTDNNKIEINAELQDINEDFNAVNSVNYNRLSSGNEFIYEIKSNDDSTLKIENEVIEPDYSSKKNNETKKHTITSSNCLIANTAYTNQIVYLNAILPKGHTFVKWCTSTGVVLSSSGENTSFIMPDYDVAISADILRNENYFTLEEKIKTAMNINSIGFTKSSYKHLQNIINESSQVLTNGVIKTTTETYVEKITNAINSLKKLCDISGDGIIDATDLVSFRKALLSYTSGDFDETFDANGDDNFNLLDLVRIKKHLANKNVPLGN